MDLMYTNSELLQMRWPTIQDRIQARWGFSNKEMWMINGSEFILLGQLQKKLPLLPDGSPNKEGAREEYLQFMTSVVIPELAPVEEVIEEPVPVPIPEPPPEEPPEE